MAKREEKRKEEPGKMTREETGKKGGEATEEAQGQESYQEMGKKSGVMPKGAAREEASEKEEVSVRRSGKDLEITFSSREEAEDWQNRLASMLEQEGYRLTREKPEAIRSEAEAAAGE